jgi:hypothetical protein
MSEPTEYHDPASPVHTELAQHYRGEKDWLLWGPYLPDRQWGTVREDYSDNGNAWDYFSHDQARCRTFRWGEDGLLGITDRQCRLCFAFAFWNGKDAILKERLFGLTNSEGNHGEDVKELYYFLDGTPTHSYAKALYKYPQRAFPYRRLIDENQRRTRGDREFEIADTGIFDDSRYFDLHFEYAKGEPEDILIRITAYNAGPDSASLCILPTVWFRNTWAWGRTGPGYWAKPSIGIAGDGALVCDHESLGRYLFFANDPVRATPLFTDNETNRRRLYGVPNEGAYSKDAFHEYVVSGRIDSVNPAHIGTKAALLYQVEIAPESEISMGFRLHREDIPLADFLGTFRRRIIECDAFFKDRPTSHLTPAEQEVVRRAYAGMLWSKQYYGVNIEEWLEGDPGQPCPSPARKRVRNWEWKHLRNSQVIAMPDRWEYPYYCAWDHAFQMLGFVDLDPGFAREQILLFLQGNYLHPNGQIPAYEFNFSDVNPPVHAWAALRLHMYSVAQGTADRNFLERVFHKLLLNFNWWVNRKDTAGNDLFGGGFLGLDNIGVFDRTRPLPGGGVLEQADGAVWMAFYCNQMLAIALVLAKENPVYEDLAIKFFDHFVALAIAINQEGGSGLWHEEDAFYYDRIRYGDYQTPLKVRSMVGIVPLCAVTVDTLGIASGLPRFIGHVREVLQERPNLRTTAVFESRIDESGETFRLQALPSRERLQRVLRHVLNEQEFLSPFGIRALSRIHAEHPYEFKASGNHYSVSYLSGESDSAMFGGNSNWCGPVWIPMNILLIDALERYYAYYGDTLKVECPTGSRRLWHLGQVAEEISRRVASLFLADTDGRRPCHGDDSIYSHQPGWRSLLLFHEYFDGDSGRGLGAAHQSGWSALVTRCLGLLGQSRGRMRVGFRYAPRD